MKAARFRPAERGEVGAVVALLADDRLGAARELASDPPAPEYLAAFDAIASDSNMLLAVAELGGEVVGCVQIAYLPGLARRGAWRGQLETVAVARHLRGRGIGTGLVRWAVERCRERGCGLVQLTSHKSRTGAHRFYRHLGFEASHEGLKLGL